MQRQWRRDRELPRTPDRVEDPRATKSALHLRCAAVSDQSALFGRALDGTACERLLPRARRARASRCGAELSLDRDLVAGLPRGPIRPLHLEQVGRARVYPAPVHACDEAESFGIDVTALRILNEGIVDMCADHAADHDGLA